MLRYPHIDPVALSAGPVQVHWYGVMYILAFFTAWWLAGVRSRRLGEAAGWTPEQISDLMFYGMLGVVLGGRIGNTLFYTFDEFLRDPMSVFEIWNGGMSFHGGLLGVIVAMIWFARKTGRRFFEVSDFVAPLVPLGLGAGRIGNFINGELWGAPTSLPWGMQVSCDTLNTQFLCYRQLGLDTALEVTPPLHPSQLYEASLEGLALFVIVWWFASRRPPYMTVSAMFLFFYGLFRFAVEFVRMPEYGQGYIAWGWLTIGQVLSLPMILLASWWLLRAWRRTSVPESSVH